MGEKKLQDNIIKDVVEKIDVFKYLSIQDILSAIYAELKQQTLRYSYRAFSRDLGFGETNYLHLICTHRRQLSPRSAQQVVSHLGLHGDRRVWFLSLVEHNGARDTAQRTAGIKKAFEVRQKSIQNELTRDEMEFFGKWYHPVVRELVASTEFSPEPRWIAAHLRPRITADQAKQSLELLLRLGYVEMDENNQIRPSYSHIRVPEGANHLSIHKYHQEMLQLSERSLSEIDAEERDLSALTVVLGGEHVAQVKQMLRDVRKKIIALSEQQTDDMQVYQMNMQLFPVTGRSK